MPQNGVFTGSIKNITVRNMNHMKHILLCLHFAYISSLHYAFSHYLRRSFYSTENFSFSYYCRSELSIILTVLIKYKNNNQLSQTLRNGNAALNWLTLLNSTHSTSHCHPTVNMGQNVPLQISANYTQTLNYCVTQLRLG